MAHVKHELGSWFQVRGAMEPPSVGGRIRATR